MKIKSRLVLSAASAAACAVLVLVSRGKSHSEPRVRTMAESTVAAMPVPRSRTTPGRARALRPEPAAPQSPILGSADEALGDGDGCEERDECESDLDRAPAVEVDLRRAALDAAVDYGQPDFAWSQQVKSDLQQAIEVWPDAKIDEAKCSVRLCRATFSASSAIQNIEELFDRVNAIPAVAGERLVQIDTDAVPAVAVAYFSRNGAISLSEYTE